jgi:hypothetical protein
LVSYNRVEGCAYIEAGAGIAMRGFEKGKNIQKKKQAAFLFRLDNLTFWLFLISSGCFFLYCTAMHKKSKFLQELKDIIWELEQEKRVSLEEREDLVLQINSRGDDAWIEMTLKKRLGMVPEGQMKVYFKKDE